MMKSVRILSGALICCWTLHAAASPRGFVDQLGDIRYWQDLDWNSAPSSAAWQDHNWVSYLGKQGSGENREKIQAFRLEGSEWQATLSQQRNSRSAPYILTIYTPVEDPPRDQCDTLTHWASRHFGPPQISIDGSYRLAAAGDSPERRAIDRHYQWVIGTTRITQDCIGQFTSSATTPPQSGYAASSLRFTPKDGSPELHPLTSAKCSRVLRLNDSSDIPLKMTDMTFVIDENNGSIRRSDLVPIRVRNVLVTSSEVRFSIVLDKSNNEYQIERTGGALSATMSISGIRAGSVSGQCSLTPILSAQTSQ